MTKTKRTKRNGPKVVVKAKKSEITDLGKALRALGSFGGGALGGVFGQPTLGASAGGGLGAVISRWLGQGDYSVRANSLVTSMRPDGSIPAMHKNDQTIVVRHKEFVGELRGKQSFTNQFRYPLNPGIASTFPWLHTLAAQFSEYRVKGMVFHYVPTSGDSTGSSNTALGSVMFQTSYRATEDAPTSKIEMMNEYWASEGRPSDSFCHPIECDPKENPFNVQYVRTGDLPATENQLMYDLATTTVAVTGMQDNDRVLGDIWLSYEIELKKPKLTGLNNEAARAFAVISNSGVSQPQPLGIGAIETNLPGVTVSGSTVTFPPNSSGDFVVTWSVYSAATLGTPGMTCTNITERAVRVTATGTTSSVLAAVIRLDPTVASSSLLFTMGTLTGGSVVSQLRVTAYPRAFD